MRSATTTIPTIPTIPIIIFYFKRFFPLLFPPPPLVSLKPKIKESTALFLRKKERKIFRNLTVHLYRVGTPSFYIVTPAHFLRTREIITRDTRRMFFASIQTSCFARSAVSFVETRERRRRSFSPRVKRGVLFPRAFERKEEKKVDEDYNIEVGIEPCLVGFVDKDSNGVEMYCCEQPDGSMECRTMTPQHEECEIFDEDGDVKVDCSPKLKAREDKM